MSGDLDVLEEAVQTLRELTSPEAFGDGRRDRARELLEACSRESEQLLSRGREGGSGESAGREDSPQKVLERALAAHARDRYEEAEAILRRGLEEFPGDVELLNHLALTCWEREAYDDAAEVYQRSMERALATAPVGTDRPRLPRKHLRAMEGRALALYRTGRRAEALSLFDALATARPSEYSGSRYLAAEIHHRAGDPAAALSHYRRADEEPAVLYNWGLALYETGDDQGAVVRWIRGMAANPYVAAELLGTADVVDGAEDGYLGSASYAEEFSEACEPLWNAAGGALELLGRCFEHPAVRSHLQGETARRRDRPDEEATPGHVADLESELQGLARHIARNGE